MAASAVGIEQLLGCISPNAVLFSPMGKTSMGSNSMEFHGSQVHGKNKLINRSTFRVPASGRLIRRYDRPFKDSETEEVRIKRNWIVLGDDLNK